MFIANREEAEKVIGRPLPPELFDLMLWGRRLIVVREPAERRIGSIIVPDQIQAAKSAGWVISCGPEVGYPEPGAPGWSPFTPKELLLKKVFFGRYAGVGIPVIRKTEDGGIEVSGGDVEPDYLMMTDMDILANF